MNQETSPTTPLPWLLEPDPANPSVRYFALTELLDRPAGDPEVQQTRAGIMASGTVPAILAAQEPEGYWVKPGHGYSPKYRGTVWQIIFLAELGADPANRQVQRGCEYLLGHTHAQTGAFSYHKTPSGTVHCLNGNLLAALLRLGYAADPRVQAALGWLVRSIRGGEGFRYTKSGTSGPGFACAINEVKPCGWGAVKALRALNAMPQNLRTTEIEQAIAACADFLLSRDPANADYPFSGRVSSTWFKFGFPLSYWSDVLENTAALVDAGYGQDPRLAGALQFILGKRNEDGRWLLENSLNSRMWINIERKGQPSKWITLRAMRVLKRINMKWQTP